ncbi:hypothetical protein QEZ52_06840 [Aliisedimentitalea scapharcae]|uniref:Uncharacterized protein n=1 Tax=Aliisedimentitalea scapharcae TaxID=1524259 RepID=A0ABZ2XZJ7_9RHOB
MKGGLHFTGQRQGLFPRLLAGGRGIEQDHQSIPQKPFQRAAAMFNEWTDRGVKGIQSGNDPLWVDRIGIGGKPAQIGKQNRNQTAPAAQKIRAVLGAQDQFCHLFGQEPAQAVAARNLFDLARHSMFEITVPIGQLVTLRMDFVIEFTQFVTHGVGILSQRAEFVLVGHLNPRIEIARGNRAERAPDALHRPDDCRGNDIPGKQRQQNRTHAGNQDNAARAFISQPSLCGLVFHFFTDLGGAGIGAALDLLKHRQNLRVHKGSDPVKFAGFPGL